MKKVVALALSAAAIRLLPLQKLHPLNWDELEFYRATSWIAEGRVPYRDFWEHHSPLAWFLFAPATWLTQSPGADAILLMRWAQIPVWIATFVCLNAWMRGAGLERMARWTAIGFALCSSLFMLPAIEYRVESVGCLLFVLGLLLAQRGRDFAAGATFCLAGLANLRLVPVLAVAVLLHWWSGTLQGAEVRRAKARRSTFLAGGLAAATVFLAYFALTGALGELWQQLWTDNRGERFATPVIGGFVHRLLVPFGVRILATDRFFEWAAVDVGGIAVLLFGFAGLVFVWREKKLRGLAVLQLVNLLFVSSMKFIYNYHFALVVVLAVPLIAWVIERIPRRELVVAVLVLAWGMNAFASVFRGKENDLAYQDRIMREVHARTRPGEKVWSGVPWALRREPAYRFWFLPELARQLVLQNLAPRYSMSDPPAAIVFDHYALVWVATIQRELAPYLVRHYMPVWRNLWVPAMNAVIRPGQRVEFVVPRDGTYRLYASPELARHRWFRDPFGAYRGEPLALRGTPQPLVISAGPKLKKGQRLSVISNAAEPLGVIMIAGGDRALFQQPPDGASLEAETTRVTHIPNS